MLCAAGGLDLEREGDCGAGPGGVGGNEPHQVGTRGEGACVTGPFQVAGAVIAGDFTDHLTTANVFCADTDAAVAVAVEELGAESCAIALDDAQARLPPRQWDSVILAADGGEFRRLVGSMSGY